MWRCTPSHGHQLVGKVYDYLEDIQPGLARKVVRGVVVSAAVTYVAVRGYRYYRARQLGRERGRAARQALQDLRDHLRQTEAREGPANKDKEAMIVALPMKDLKEKLRTGELKALEVLRAYQRKALQVNDELNCVTEPIVEAELWAIELDKVRPEQRGPLHGIPVSIKDSINIKGYDCHIGFSVLIGQQAEKDADIVQLLKSLGAVPFVRTNFPQGLLSYACSNPVYGRTKNPYGASRGPGGSSGGEGALLGGGGSVVGIGSDIGGSVRIPAHMCGIYCLKPTVERFLLKGHIPLLMGQTAVRPTNGPMTRDMDGLIELTRALYTTKMHDIDSTVPPYGFREEVLEQKGALRVGFFTNIEGLQAHPACVRAVMEAKAALEQKGHEVIPFEIPEVYPMFCELWVKGILADGKEIDALIKDDVLDTCVSSMYYPGKLPLPVKYIVSKLTSLVDPPHSQMTMAMAKLPRTVGDYWDVQAKIVLYKMMVEKAWKNQKLDALLCPGYAFPAITAGYEETVFYSIVYTAMFNTLNFPVGVLPVSEVTEQDIRDLKDPAVFPVNGFFEKFLIKDSEGSVGLPVGVQCASLPYQEELVLRVMKDIDTVLRN